MPDPIRIYTPKQSTYNKMTPGKSDVSLFDRMMTFMGCPISSLNMSAGFNGTASSLSVILVEDPTNGLFFNAPTIPSIHGFSLPVGGVGQPVIYEEFFFDQTSYYDEHVPFYFAGICTNYSAAVRDLGGQTITVNLVDARELMSGIQCLLSGFALSQEVGVGFTPAGQNNNIPTILTPGDRYTGVNNVVDCFGSWNYGMDSEKNAYGMTWEKIKDVLENVRVTIDGMHFEFHFEGVFNTVPSFYRLDEQIMDLLSLCQKVASDAGADFITVGRKVSSDTMVIEIRGISRTKLNELKRGELARFVAARSSIVENVKIGREYRNEPDSSIIVGGFKNSNYVAYPSTYDAAMHLDDHGFEDYNAFPRDIQDRLFGGVTTKDEIINNELVEIDAEFDVDSGAIFPYWGTDTHNPAYPLMEPFLTLEHLVFDPNTENVTNIRNRIPFCKISIRDYNVRKRTHSDVFLAQDGEQGDRPFAFVESYQFAGVPSLDGYTKGLPLNTEVLRAALAGVENSFWPIYSLYYPDIADQLLLPQPDFLGMFNWMTTQTGITGHAPDLANVQIIDFLYASMKNVEAAAAAFTRDQNGKIPRTAFDAIDAKKKVFQLMVAIRSVIFNHIRQYATDYMGRQFMVCLPRSAIMERIWAGLPVPTRTEAPQIEYVLDQLGFWETVPEELNGVVDPNHPGDSVFSEDEEQQIRNRFMQGDSRWSPMVAMAFRPTGNASFNSNGINKSMFQDLPVDAFRPNRISSRNPQYVFISASSIQQMIRRPDLAHIEIPGPVWFDPTFGVSVFERPNAVASDHIVDDELLARKAGIMKYFWYLYEKDKHGWLRQGIASMKTDNLYPGYTDQDQYANKIFSSWADQLIYTLSMPFMYNMSTEPVMDLALAVIPLTSTYVSYGPWYYNYAQATGSIKVDVDQSLVPWNFSSPKDIDPLNTTDSDGKTAMQRLDEAGFIRLAQSLSGIDYLDNASICVAGYPEYGPAAQLGYHSNITGMSVNFAIDGIKTTYNMSTYAARPGTFRKNEYDNLSKARIDTRVKLPDPENLGIAKQVFDPGQVNRFPY